MIKRPRPPILDDLERMRDVLKRYAETVALHLHSAQVQEEHIADLHKAHEVAQEAHRRTVAFANGEKTER